jgi:hypothetical protein
MYLNEITDHAIITLAVIEQTIMRYVKYQEKEDLGQAKLALD